MSAEKSWIPILFPIPVKSEIKVTFFPENEKSLGNIEGGAPNTQYSALK